jgi:hypothetical protein
MRTVHYLLGCFVCSALVAMAQAPLRDSRFTIPRTWDDQAMRTLELPLADPAATPKHISADYYYRIPVRPVFKSYPAYHPSREPRPGGQPYLKWLEAQRPQRILEDFSDLRTEADWLAKGPGLGRDVFEAAFADDLDPFFGIVRLQDLRDPDWYRRTGVPFADDGVVPFVRYIVTEKGVRVGNVACAMCHTRVVKLDGGKTLVVQGAQGNFPFDRAIGEFVKAAGKENLKETLEIQRAGNRLLFGAPWLSPDPLAPTLDWTLESHVATAMAIPAGTLARHGASVLSPVQIPDLIGIQERRYLDRTGLVRHRSAVDLMRYAALNQAADLLNQYGTFIPAGENERRLPPPDQTFPRFSDEQLYALALFLYSLRPPQNPHLPKTQSDMELVATGARLFDREACGNCHAPPAYTNNKLVRAPGFTVADAHPERANVLAQRVGSDPYLATQTRRGTGLYKVPSLKGLWYRGPLEHNGSVATLEDWFDPRRLEDDYEPTGWTGPAGIRKRAVKGHEFGIDLSVEERKALIAFLRTL